NFRSEEHRFGTILNRTQSKHDAMLSPTINAADQEKERRVPASKIGLFYVVTLLIGAMLPALIPWLENLLDVLRNTDSFLTGFVAWVFEDSSYSLLRSMIRLRDRGVSFRMRDI